VTTCSKCDRPHHALGLCGNHYQQERRRAGKGEDRDLKLAYNKRRQKAMTLLAQRRPAEFAAILHQLELAERRQRIAALNAQIMAERGTS
jgi:hypothetical protein